MEILSATTYGSKEYVQTLGLGGGGTSSAGFFFRSVSFSFSCLTIHCKLDKQAS